MFFFCFVFFIFYIWNFFVTVLNKVFIRDSQCFILFYHVYRYIIYNRYFKHLTVLSTWTPSVFAFLLSTFIVVIYFLILIVTFWPINCFHFQIIINTQSDTPDKNGERGLFLVFPSRLNWIFWRLLEIIAISVEVNVVMRLVVAGLAHRVVGY